MANTASNRAIKIEDLQEKYNISESNLIIVEDEIDTKKATVKELRKSFSGDGKDPTRDYFYSSHYINELLNSLNIAISNKASKETIKNLEAQLDAIIASQTNNIDPTKIDLAEIITARGDQNTLSDRLIYEREISNSSYFKRAAKEISGKRINIDGNEGLVTVMAAPENMDFVSNAPGKVLCYSKNRLNIDSIILNDSIRINESNGIIYTQSNTLINKIEIPLDKKCEAGIYYFISSVNFSDKFIDKEITLEVEDITGNIVQFPYDHSRYFEFKTEAAFSKISLCYPSTSEGFDTKEYVEFSNIMLSKYKLDTYVEYEYSESKIMTYYTPIIMYNKDYIFEYSLQNSILAITYYDHTITVDSIVDRIINIEKSANDKIDKCGLMTDYGTYHSFESCTLVSSELSGTLSNADKTYERNGFVSKKIEIIYNDSEDFQIKQELTGLPETLESVSLCFYIDKTVIDCFTDESGIMLVLCSDDPAFTDNINRCQTLITRNELVQGWNVIKRPISEFVSYNSPDLYDIKSASLIVLKNENLDGKEFFINSLSFNQKMKPTVIFSFDGTYENSLKDAYQYMETKNIPATVLLNDSRTIDPDEFNELIRLRINKGWDIGVYGSHIATTQKEYMQHDDNFRNQYIGLYNNREFIRENVIDNPISYSAPYGNLRPITVPLLKDLGFKIARTDANSYISIFTEKDFSIPMTLISNELLPYSDDISPITELIDYAISNNVAVSLYTREVTEYGTEASARKANFESIIKYIYDRVKEGKLQVLTMADFYRKCVE